jgi:HEAT repeat protein
LPKSAGAPKKEDKSKKTTGKSAKVKSKTSGKSTPSKMKQKPLIKKELRKTSVKGATKKISQTKTPKKTGPRKKTTRSDNEHILRELEVEIKSDDEQVCLGAIERLSLLKDPRATDILIEGLTDPRQIVRIHAAAQLGERRDSKATDALIDTLNDKSVFVRQTAAGALENMGGAKAKKAIARSEKEGTLLDELPEGRRLAD